MLLVARVCFALSVILASHVARAQTTDRETKGIERSARFGEKERPAWRSEIERQFGVEQSDQINVLVGFGQAAARSKIDRERQAYGASREGSLDGWRAANAADSKSLTARLQSIGAEVIQSYEYLPYLLVRISQSDLDALAEVDGVVSVSPNLESRTDSRKTPDPEFSGPGRVIDSPPDSEPPDREKAQLDVSTDAIKARDAWALGFDGREQVVAVLDNGIFSTHEMFQNGRIVTEACFSGAAGVDLVPRAGLLSLCPNALTQVKGAAGAASLCSGGDGVCEHGTTISGIVMGYTAPWVDRSKNSSNTRLGVAPLASVLPIQVFSRRTSGCPSGNTCLTAMDSDILAALNYLVDVVNQKLLPSPKQLVAVNMSIGGNPVYGDYCYDIPVRSGILLLRQLGVLTVIASGNDSAFDRVSAPACVKEAITVAASNRDNTAPAGYSNRSRGVDVIAPGGASSSAPIFSAGTATTTSYIGKIGTSVAAPHVAGTIAILRSKSRNATADQIEWAIKKGATKGGPLRAEYKAWMEFVLDVMNAIDIVGQKPALGVPIAGYYPDSFSGGFGYARVYNPNSTSGSVNITLVRDDTGEILGSSLQAVPAHSALQIQMKTLQASVGGSALNIPNTTTLSVYFDATFLGYAQNVLWNAAAKSLTNITSCADNQPDFNDMLGNVHTALIDGEYPSAIRIHNKAPIAQRAIFDIYNATTGGLLGRWTTADPITSNTTKMYSAMTAYKAIDFTPDANTYHTTFRLRSAPVFVLGHVVNNLSASLMTDMTPKCRI